MGLDSYLYANYGAYGGYDHIRNSNSESDREETRIFDEVLSTVGLELGQFESMRSVDLKVNVGYWRKANAIHAWFVNNTQDGKDECEESYVSREQLEELLAICERLVATADMGKAATEKDMFGEEYTFYPNFTMDSKLAAEILPSSSGFFFGSTDYDNWYYNDLVKTIELIKSLKASKLWNSRSWSFAYQASW